MPGIDDPLDAVKNQYPARSAVADALINAGAELHPFAGMVNAVRSFFSKKEAEARIEALLKALEWYVREHERRIEDLSEKTSSPEFIETLLVAADKALHASNVEKIKRFAYVLGHELLSGRDPRGYEDDAAYTRTLSELGEVDIQVLSVIQAFQSYLLDNPTSHKGDRGRLFWGLMGGVYGELNERGIPYDEFFSRASKLNGYGLVHRVGSGAGFWWADDGGDMPYEIEGGAYFITSSGRKLIDIIGDSPDLLAAADEHREQVLADIEKLKAGTLNKFPQPYRPRK